MNRRFLTYLLAMLLLIHAPVVCAERLELMLQGNKASGEMVDNHIYVDLTSLRHAVEARVAWFPASGVVAIFYDDSTAKMTVGSRQANIDGSVRVLDYPPLLRGGRVLVPTGILREVFGFVVDLDHSVERSRNLVDIQVRSGGGSAEVELHTTLPLRPGDWTYAQRINPDRLIITLFKCGLALAGEHIEAREPLKRVLYGQDEGLNVRVVLYTDDHVETAVVPMEGDMGLKALIARREIIDTPVEYTASYADLQPSDDTTISVSHEGLQLHRPDGVPDIHEVSGEISDMLPPTPERPPVDSDMLPPTPERPPVEPDMLPPTPERSPVEPDLPSTDPEMQPEIPDMPPDSTLDMSVSVPAARINEISRDVLSRLNAKRQARDRRTRAKVPSGFVVAIDPGHGGRDSGVRVDGESESKIVLDVALRLKELLKEMGISVMLTRDADEFVELHDRTVAANVAGADVFVSLHANASYSHRARGMEIYTLHFEDEPLSVATSNTTDPVLADRSLRRWRIIRKREETHRFSSIMRETLAQELPISVTTFQDARLMPLSGLTMPGMVVELGYLTNPYERRLLTNSYYREELADALAEALRRYVITVRTAVEGGAE